MQSPTAVEEKQSESKTAESQTKLSLSAEETAILERQLSSVPSKTSFFALFRYATRTDKIVLGIASICSIAVGAVNPVMTIVFGHLATYFQEFLNGSLDGPAFSRQLSNFTLYYVYLGIAQFVLSYASVVGHTYVGEHVASRIREQYLAAVLRQNIAFFDNLGSGEITNRMTSDINTILNGTSTKVGSSLTAIFTLVAAFAVAFSQSWKLTLILSSTVVAVVIIISIGSKFAIKSALSSLDPKSAAGTISEEAFSSIRNVTAFGAQDAILKNYQRYARKAQRWATKSKIWVSLMVGAITGIVCLNYGLAFWMGARFLVDGQLNLGNILTSVLSIMIGAVHLGVIGPSVQAIVGATAASSHIFSVIDRQSPIDPNGTGGITLADPQGAIEFRNIKMVYPSRPETLILENLNLTFPKGKTTALVGTSGSGKSTIVGLLERFYDPIGGEVTFDGTNIQDLNLRWLRQQIALVTQEPTLFNITVAENIAYGLVGSRFENLTSDEKQHMIEEAAKKSNAHDFILNLPYGYDTQVGQQGGMLSGGQKQRIVIARAVIGDPKVLLLDEATSALDTKSERIVQLALAKAAEGRTTIMIAHRLSTIKTADNIIVMSHGIAVEQGTHESLLVKQGAYHDLVHAQRFEEEESTQVEQVELRSNDSLPDVKEAKEDIELDVSESSPKVNSPDQVQSHHSLWTLIKFTASFNKKEWHIMLFGFVNSILAGAGIPVQAIFFAKAITNLSEPSDEYGTLVENVSFWSLMFLMLGFEQTLSYVAQGAAFALCSEQLLVNTSSEAFKSLLRQDIEFFEDKKHGSGALNTFLNSDLSSLDGLSGSSLGTILISLTTLVAAIILSCSFYWKLGLVCTSTIPVLLGCGFLRIWLLSRYQSKSNAAYQKCATFACEAIAAMRTIASLSRENDVLASFHHDIDVQQRQNMRDILKTGLLFAASNAVVLFVTALAFWYGGVLIGASEIGLYQFFLCFSAIVFGTQSAGGVFAFAPDISNAKSAASALKAQLDTKPTIDSSSTEGKIVDKVQGEIEFQDVHFSYPTRPNEAVLSGLSFKANRGSYAALVGASGCGKSTTIGLLERFYSPKSGRILLDGVPISSYNISSLRQQMALVIQEPTLYQGTIMENLVLGVEEGSVSDTEIDAACQSANIYEFIMSLPDGYSTTVGSKGSMLSGGQKQRIAIARALIRNPAVLLLDEATSALDSQSEEVVQAALDAASRGRTTISIAHRLSSIQRADVINVIDGGRVVESGSHTELLSLGGLYYDLVNSQSLEQ